MTIATAKNTPRNTYTATSSQTVFTIAFEFFATSDIKVYRNGTALTYNAAPSSVAQFSVQGTANASDSAYEFGAGGTVTLGGGATADDVIVIIRDIIVERTTDFTPAASFDVAALNTQLDTLMAMMAEREQGTSRSVRLADTDVDAATVTLPDKATRASKQMEFDSDGNVTVGTGTVGVTSSAAELNILDGCTLTVGELNQFDGFTIADEDNMSSNSATKLATQQSIKAYVDTVILTEDTLAEMNDTNITSAADGSMLLYDTGTSTWIDNVMSGDATMADTGVITLAANSVDSDQYVDGSIDTAHIANDQITAALMADNSIDSDMYVDGSIDTAHIANDQITNALMADDAIDSAQIADGSVDTAHIADLNVTTGKIAADAITGAKIADDAIDSEHYTDGSIDTAHIADLNVTSGKIAADAITAAKIADDAISEEHLDATVISGLSDTTIAAADYLMFWDVTDSALKKVDAAELGVGSSLTSLAGDSSPQLGGTLDVNGNLIDMNGLADGLVLDTDGDTTISSPTDDQIDFEIAGADDFRMTANSFNILSGSSLVIDSGATITNSGTATGFGIIRPNSKAILLNGDMQVAQRSASTTGLGDGDEGYVTVDRVRHTIGATSAGRFTSAQTAVTDLAGFSNCLHLDCTTADASIAAGELFTLDWRIEGQDLQMAKKGHSDAEAITISFWMKAEDAKVYVIELSDIDNTRHIAQTFTSATSWTQHVLSFAGDTTGKITNDNAESLRVRMWLHAGATYTGGTLASSWAATNNANSAAGIGSFFDNTNNDIKLTGMQLEIGSYTTATIPSFQYASYADNLERCYRYFKRHSHSVNYAPVMVGYASGTGSSRCMQQFFVPMRVAPTMTSNGDFVRSHGTATAMTVASVTSTADSISVDFSATGVFTDQQGVVITFKADSTAFIQYDAEL